VVRQVAERREVVDGTEKNPCTWGACSAIVITRSAPAVAIRSATSRPAIEMRGASFLSERAYA
jgi:hypothetical protein